MFAISCKRRIITIAPKCEHLVEIAIFQRFFAPRRHNKPIQMKFSLKV